MIKERLVLLSIPGADCACSVLKISNWCYMSSVKTTTTQIGAAAIDHGGYYSAVQVIVI